MRIRFFLAACLLLTVLVPVPHAAPPQECGASVAVEMFGVGTAGVSGVPTLENGGIPIVGSPYAVEVSGGAPASVGFTIIGVGVQVTPLAAFGGEAYATPLVVDTFATDAQGSSGALDYTIPPIACGLDLVFQAAVLDGAAVGGAALTQALIATPGVAPPDLFPGAVYAAGSFSRGIKAADVDLDGKLDVVGANEGFVALYHGDGNGGFLPVVEVPVSASVLQEVAVRDLNADGRADLVAADLAAQHAHVLLADTAGGFLAGPDVDTQDVALSVELVDLDNDGVQDLLAGTADLSGIFPAGRLQTFRGNGDGSFAGVDATGEAVGSVTALQAGDVNGDGSADVAFGRSFLNVATVLLGNGDVSVSSGVDLPLGMGPQELRLADLDLDGALDLVAAAGFLRVSLGNGDGTFGAVAALTDFDLATISLEVADTNGDAIPDLLTSTAVHRFATLLGDGTGAFPTQIDADLAITSLDIVAEDFNGDGAVDVVLSNGGLEGVTALRGLGDGAFHIGELIEVGNGSNAVAIADLNGDGLVDLVAADTIFDAVEVRLATGAGAFAPPVSHAVGDSPEAIVARDLDGDGVVDLAVANEGSDDVSVLLGQGGGSFALPVHLSTGGSDPRALTVGDVNADDVADLIVANAGSGDLSVLFGDGSGGWTLGALLPVGLRPFSIASADLDGLGGSDVVITDVLQGTVVVVLNDGQGALTQTSYPVGDGANSVAIADLDGDGVLDLAVSFNGLFTFSGGVSVLTGLGAGAFGPAQLLSTGSPAHVAAVDLEDDGWLDLVSLDGSLVRVLHNDAGSGFTQANSYLMGSAPQESVAADVNGDGAIDLVVAMADGVVVLRSIVLL